MSKFTGTKAATEQPKRYGYDPTRGYYTIRTWRGGTTEIRNLLSAFAAGGVAYVVTDYPMGYSQVEATYSNDQATNNSDQTVENTWELMPNKVMKDLLDSESTAVKSISKANRASLRDYLKKGTNPGTLTGTALNLQHLIDAGVTSVEVDQAIIRNTQTVSAAYLGKADMLRVGKILTLASLMTEGVPTAILFRVSDFPSGRGERPNGWEVGNELSYGWRKCFPTVQRQAWNKWQIQREWQFGLWSEVLYGAPV